MGGGVRPPFGRAVATSRYIDSCNYEHLPCWAHSPGWVHVGGLPLSGPEDKEEKAKEEEAEDFEPVEEEVEEFESVEEEEPAESVEEFESLDENAPDDIDSSGFKTKKGDIPGYEPTVDEVLSYAMGKTEDPSEPIPPKTVDTTVGDSLSSLLAKTKIKTTEDDEEIGEEEGDEELPEEDLADIFDDDEKE